MTGVTGPSSSVVPWGWFILITALAGDESDDRLLLGQRWATVCLAVPGGPEVRHGPAFGHWPGPLHGVQADPTRASGFELRARAPYSAGQPPQGRIWRSARSVLAAVLRDGRCNRGLCASVAPALRRKQQP